MKPSRRVRPVAAVAVLAAVVLSACGASAPPAKELANELVDTLEVSDEVKACMHEAIDDFGLTESEAQGFEDFDDVAQKASEGNELAIQVMDRFEASLAACQN